MTNHIIKSSILLLLPMLSGCYHLQLARSPLPVVYQEDAITQPKEQPHRKIRFPKNKPVKKSVKEPYLYILEDWF